MKILAIETSCDDTCVAILEVKELKNSVSFKVLSNIIQSQTIHAEYGGVFPMMAKREHMKNIGPIFEAAMKEVKNPKVDAIAVTVGPGLEPALWVGIVFAKDLASKLKVPLIPVNHMEGHILSVLVNKGDKFIYKKDTLEFPVLSLLVSGGHTEIVLTKKFGNYKVIGQTRDDAAGEAFDKVARMLGLPYPGGPEISRLAETERKNKASEKNSEWSGPRSAKPSRREIRGPEELFSLADIIKFPRPMIYTKDYDFSFSGLKTAVLYYIRDNGPLNEKMKSGIAREFEDAAIEVLTAKTIRAIKQYKAKTLVVGGGVSANTYLQETLKKVIKKESPETTIHFPVKKLSTDNALMIAIAGYFNLSKKSKGVKLLKAQGNLVIK